jgi:hypothetical protein
MKTSLQEAAPFDSRGAIHLQRADRDPAFGCQADDLALADFVVLIPAVRAV